MPSTRPPLFSGVYERLLDEELNEAIQFHPDLQATLRKIDDESSPHAYAQFVGQILQRALRSCAVEERRPLINRLLELLAARDGLDYLLRRRLLEQEPCLLTEVHPAREAGQGRKSLPRPETPLSCSALLTGQRGDPPLEHELRAEMASADRVDILVSFIKYSGLRLLMPAIEALQERDVLIRIISTSYMGASDPAALEYLAQQPHCQVRIAYNTDHTRLHAKAFHFARNSGYSTAYIGSANISHPALTQGLEWTLKVTAQDSPHIIERFKAEFDAYWHHAEFETFTEVNFPRFRSIIAGYRKGDHESYSSGLTRFFADITPRPFQQRILGAIAASRQGGFHRNLVVAATGTGKTVIAALDYRQAFISQDTKTKPRLLFVVHRKEILHAALDCFRAVLRDANFGELLVDGQQPKDWQHVFASVQSLGRQLRLGTFAPDHFEHLIVDEAHHGAASSYRPLFDELKPKQLVGLTATPERMDGSSTLPDFGNRITAEIRLPEALREKLLCPFHYFGVTDNVDTSGEAFWRKGRYAMDALENVYTGDDLRAKQRVDIILQALDRYQPDLTTTRGVGFCAGVRHAHFMADHFRKAGLSAETLLGETAGDARDERLRRFKEGSLQFLFTVDLLSEGVDIPEINLVLFLRPTESLTVFLQQLGRGLRHAPGKDCLTVLDMVGQTHHSYRIDTRYAALVGRQRGRIDDEIRDDFPSLPPGCSIQFERVARERVLEKVDAALKNLKVLVGETIRTWGQSSDQPLTFGHFIDMTDLSPIQLLSKQTWSAWKAEALGQRPLDDPDLTLLSPALSRLALRDDPEILGSFFEADHRADSGNVLVGDSEDASKRATILHYLRWGKSGKHLGISEVAESSRRWERNPSIVQDAAEIAAWRLAHPQRPVINIDLPFACGLKLHASYSALEINAALGLASVDSTGPIGTGVVHAKDLKCYAHLITFQKDDRHFSPTTRYRDYPISGTELHWESKSTITRASPTGQNYLNFHDRGYTILFFARVTQQVEQQRAPFQFLGPASHLISAEGDRPIAMVWKMKYPMPAGLLEETLPV
ncbi:DUF3427 domain-containing protein [Allohahella sp. A8]|uniref:DUF3427 domain-containing protein n=1 Tax=Allohahella sp. A8 TaxID=3141461 RepID=UPI003A7FA8B5